MVPLMYLLQMNFTEVPQRTHRWNNTKLPASAISHFDASEIVTVTGDADAKRRWWGILPIFHMPILGGWDEFVVLKPVQENIFWHVGWLPIDTIGVSQIPLKGNVRVLVGPRQVQFFGVDQHGSQIPIEVVARGVIGKAGSYGHTVLL